MTLLVLTVVVIGSLISVLAIHLYLAGVLLNRVATNLGDCLPSVQIITGQAKVIGSGVTRLDKTAGDLLGSIPLSIEGAERVAAKLAPSVATTHTPVAAPAAYAVGGTRDGSHSGVAAPDAIRASAGYVEAAATPVGYLDV